MYNGMSLSARHKFTRGNILDTDPEKQQQLRQSIEDLAGNPGQASDPAALTHLLKQCSNSASIHEGRRLHAIAATFGLDRDRYVGSFLVQMYGLCGSVVDAKQVFDNLVVKNVFSWTIFIGACADNGCGREAIAAYHTMNCEGIHPDSITLLNTVGACSISGNLSEGKLLHERIASLGYDLDRGLVSALINMYGKCGDLDRSRKLFAKSDSRDPVAWNSMIGAYAQAGHLLQALELYTEMEFFGVRWNKVTFVTLLSGLCDPRFLEQGRKVHSSVEAAGLESDVVVGTALVNMYGKCSRVDEARAAFEKISRPNVVSWSALLTAYVQNGQAKVALEVYNREKSSAKGMATNRVTFISLLDACSCLGALAEGRKIHAAVIERKFETDLVICNALVNFYGKCGSLAEAKLVFDGMRRRDVISWSSMISALAQRGHLYEVLELYHQMLSDGTPADDIVFVSLLFGCSNSGVVEAAGDMFRFIVGDTDVKPTLEHYACMVDVLARSGKLAEADDLLRLMPFYPGPLLYMTLLSSCNLYTDVERGEAAAEMVFELDPENSSPYITLASIYSAAKRPKDAARIRRLMEERGIKKKPGCSWIEVDDQVHEFIAGDKLHPRREEIYAEIQWLSEEMKQAGYVQDTKVVLQDIEEEEKEKLLWYHSEKLALCFGLISTPKGAPLRIVKNLRVCSDCHAAFKVVSEITRREILVRDTNRFHNFRNGVCSCRDYW